MLVGLVDYQGRTASMGTVRTSQNIKDGSRTSESTETGILDSAGGLHMILIIFNRYHRQYLIGKNVCTTR